MRRKQRLNRRTELKQGAPLKRGGGLKQTPLRRRSKKKEREIQETKDDRRLYREAHPYCVICGAPTTDVHEIPKGGARQRSVRNPDCWIPTCNQCNCDDLEDYDQWPPERQIALKMLLVLRTNNEIRSGLPQARLPDVIEHLKELVLLIPTS